MLLDKAVHGSTKLYPYTILLAGPTRRVRVNTDWIRHGDGKPFIVAELDAEGKIAKTTQYTEVLIPGSIKLVSLVSKKFEWICGVKEERPERHVWIETTGEVHVRS